MSCRRSTATGLVQPAALRHRSWARERPRLLLAQLAQAQEAEHCHQGALQGQATRRPQLSLLWVGARARRPERPPPGLCLTAQHRPKAAALQRLRQAPLRRWETQQALACPLVPARPPPPGPRARAQAPPQQPPEMPQEPQPQLMPVKSPARVRAPLPGPLVPAQALPQQPPR